MATALRPEQYSVSPASTQHAVPAQPAMATFPHPSSTSVPTKTSPFMTNPLSMRTPSSLPPLPVSNLNLHQHQPASRALSGQLNSQAQYPQQSNSVTAFDSVRSHSPNPQPSSSGDSSFAHHPQDSSSPTLSHPTPPSRDPRSHSPISSFATFPLSNQDRKSTDISGPPLKQQRICPSPSPMPARSPTSEDSNASTVASLPSPPSPNSTQILKLSDLQSKGLTEKMAFPWQQLMQLTQRKQQEQKEPSPILPITHTQQQLHSARSPPPTASAGMSPSATPSLDLSDSWDSSSGPSLSLPAALQRSGSGTATTLASADPLGESWNLGQSAAVQKSGNIGANHLTGKSDTTSQGSNSNADRRAGMQVQADVWADSMQFGHSCTAGRKSPQITNKAGDFSRHHPYAQNANNTQGAWADRKLTSFWSQKGSASTATANGNRSSSTDAARKLPGVKAVGAAKSNDKSTPSPTTTTASASTDTPNSTDKAASKAGEEASKLPAASTPQLGKSGSSSSSPLPSEVREALRRRVSAVLQNSGYSMNSASPKSSIAGGDRFHPSLDDDDDLLPPAPFPQLSARQMMESRAFYDASFFHVDIAESPAMLVASLSGPRLPEPLLMAALKPSFTSPPPPPAASKPPAISSQALSLSPSPSAGLPPARALSPFSPIPRPTSVACAPLVSPSPSPRPFQNSSLQKLMTPTRPQAQAAQASSPAAALPPKAPQPAQPPRHTQPTADVPMHTVIPPRSATPRASTPSAPRPSGAQPSAGKPPLPPPTVSPSPIAAPLPTHSLPPVRTTIAPKQPIPPPPSPLSCTEDISFPSSLTSALPTTHDTSFALNSPSFSPTFSSSHFTPTSLSSPCFAHNRVTSPLFQSGQAAATFFSSMEIFNDDKLPGGPLDAGISLDSPLASEPHSTSFLDASCRALHSRPSSALGKRSRGQFEEPMAFGTAPHEDGGSDSGEDEAITARI